MKIVLNSYKDPSCGKDWDEQRPLIEKELSSIINDFDKKISFTLTEADYGKGADWPTTEILLECSPVAIVILPALFHKYIREALEEYRIFYNYMKKFINYVSMKFSIVSKPDVVLCLDAMNELANYTDESNIKFVDYKYVTKIGSRECLSGLHEFYFSNENKQWLVSINGKGKVQVHWVPLHKS